MQRPEVVDHGRADSTALRRLHPVCELQDVEVADEPLGCGTAECRPRAPDYMTEGNRDRLALEREIAECTLEGCTAADAHRTEGDELVVSVHRKHSFQRAEDVVADARSRMRERRDVVGDPHGAV